ncbi:hypothetical protein C0995_010180 [Termitomyces sp. Mi166|nr:hypothetical protein C0995_010180 [Termitomyces sp. Mi166\
MAFQSQPQTSESLTPQQRSVRPQGQQQLRFESDYEQQSYIESDYEQRLYVKNLGAVQDKSCIYQAPEYSGGLGEGAAYRPPYSQDELTDEGRYERPQYMRSYASTVTQPMLPAWAGGRATQPNRVDERQHVSALEQIERVGKHKAPAFEEPMVEPKQARAPSQRPQELAWVPARTVARLPP